MSSSSPLTRGRLLLDAERCTGCGCCEMACSLHNDQECNPSRSRIYVARSREGAFTVSVPVTCRQCEDALCVTMCPADALRRRDADGTVVVDSEACIGCRTCVEVCPLGAPAVDPRLGKSRKCALCDGDPVCVKVCGEHALVYVRAEEEGLHRKRAAVEAYLEYMTSATPVAGQSHRSDAPA